MTADLSALADELDRLNCLATWQRHKNTLEKSSNALRLAASQQSGVSGAEQMREALKVALPIVKMVALTDDDPEYMRAETLMAAAIRAMPKEG